MTDQEINIAIAEACGIEPCSLHSSYDCAATTRDGCGLCPTVPNYASDLNAMHGAESYKMLGEDPDAFCQPYSGWLDTLTKGTAWNANARQRAEAFLRTIGKWKD